MGQTPRGDAGKGVSPTGAHCAAFPALARHACEGVLVSVVKQIRLPRHAELRVFLIVKPVLVEDRDGQLIAHGLELFVEEPV